MTTYTATTTAQAAAYITAARGGDTILLAPGTYDGLRLSNINKGSAVLNIASLDPNNEAVLTSFSADKVNGIKFSNLEFYTTSDNSMWVTNSHVLTFDNVDVHGTLNGSSSDDHRGLLLKNSSYITITNSHFHELTDAINPAGNQMVTISGNTFDTLRDDGIAGSSNSQITISNNLFTNFDHTGGVHPDAIQFWTVGTTKASSDITIKDNVIDRGTGTAVQGIFMNDEVGTLPYANVSISGNVVLGELYNGISIYHATNATLSGNVVLAAADQQSWIGLFGVASAQLDDNVATGYSFKNSTVVGHGDVSATVIQMQDDGSYLSPLTKGSTLSPSVTGMAERAADTVQAAVNLLGFTDGASRFGLTHDFAIIGIEGTDGDNRLVSGGIGTYHLYGFDGNDLLLGSRTASSILEGGDGNDSYTIYKSNDTIVEAADGGTDTVYTYANYTLPDNVESIRAMSAGLTLMGNALDNGMVAQASGSTLYGMDGNDYIQGGAGNDRLYGGNGDDRLMGGDGNDYIDSGSGNDNLYGGNGNDVLIGGVGKDYYEGGAGIDTMTGGAGVDTYVYRTGDFGGGAAANRDIITNFSVSDGDRIALNMVDAKSATSAADRFTFIGNQAFHGVAGELRWAADGDGITVYGDTNGDKTADLAIHLIGLTSITSSSFIL